MKSHLWPGRARGLGTPRRVGQWGRREAGASAVRAATPPAHARHNALRVLPLRDEILLVGLAGCRGDHCEEPDELQDHEHVAEEDHPDDENEWRVRPCDHACHKLMVAPWHLGDHPGRPRQPRRRHGHFLHARQRRTRLWQARMRRRGVLVKYFADLGKKGVLVLLILLLQQRLRLRTCCVLGQVAACHRPTDKPGHCGSDRAVETRPDRQLPPLPGRPECAGTMAAYRTVGVRRAQIPKTAKRQRAR